MPKQGEVDFRHSSRSEGESLPELNSAMQGVFNTFQANKEDLIRRVHQYENESGSPDVPFTEDGSKDEKGRIRGLSYHLISPTEFSIQFDGGLYHGQAVKLELIEAGDESKKPTVGVELEHMEQSSAGKLFDAVKEILTEQGYTAKE